MDLKETFYHIIKTQKFRQRVLIFVRIEKKSAQMNEVSKRMLTLVTLFVECSSLMVCLRMGVQDNRIKV